MHFIETDRLILREYKAEDIAELARISSDDEVMEFFVSKWDFDKALDFARKQNEQMKIEKFGFFAVEEKESGKFIGFVGLNRIDIKEGFGEAVEIGWRLAFDKWNRGLATEAALSCLKYGFEAIGFDEIVAFTALTNKKSQKIMEKIGMKRDLAGDFLHPQVPCGHPLKQHVLYRV